MSQRAQAQEIYRAITDEKTATCHSAPPTPGPSPPFAAQTGGGEQNASQGLTAQNLTEKVRALYEGSAVPVAAIAKLAGVSERTIYKYARKGHWKPRYAWVPDGARPPGKSARRWTTMRGKGGRGFAPAKGAGGRFITRADKGKPFAVGIAATDPARAVRAGRACAKAAEIGAAAQAQAGAAQRAEARIRAMEAVTCAIAAVVRERCGEDGKRGVAQDGREDKFEDALFRVVGAQVRRWELLLAEDS